MKNSILKALNKLTGGKGDKKSLSDFPSKEVVMGQKVEMEHTSDPKLADEITADHLTENPHYYSKLKESGLADELEKGARGDWKGEGYKISHKVISHNKLSDHDKMLFGDQTIIEAHDSEGNKVGHLSFDAKQHPKHIMPRGAFVEDEHQRKGLASAMYSHAEKITGKKIKPQSGHQTPEAKALWSQPNRPFGKTESLAKAPVEYEVESQGMSSRPIKPLDSRFQEVKQQKLPNGMTYTQHSDNAGTHYHRLYHPDHRDPVAEIKTQSEDAEAPNTSNHTVVWSQVSPNHKGKGYGKQAYLAALVHGKGVGRLLSDNNVSQNAHKVWKQFKDVKGLGGRIGKYLTSEQERKNPWAGRQAYEDQHQVFIKQKSALDHNAMFPPIERSGQEKLAASEPLEKDQPALKFPKVKNVPTRTDVELYSIPEGRTKSANRKKQIAARAGTNRARLGYEEVSGKKLPQTSYDKDVANKKKLISEIANSRDKKGVSAGVVSTPGMGGKSFKGRSIGYYSETNPRYVQQHEAAHLTLQHIADKHGENARRKVVDHLLAHFHPDDVNAMARKLGGGSYSQSNHLSEEVLNFLHDLPHKDEKIKAHYAAHGVDENRVKAGWKRASQYAREKITPEWLAGEGNDVNSIREQSKSLRPTDLTLRNPGKLAASEMAKAETAEQETEKIKENKKTEKARNEHKFQAAKWTHPNGHPRCIICGDEERVGGMCSGADSLEKSLNRKTGVSGVSENIGLDRLKQIKQDNYVGAGGKDYSPDELHQRMFEIQDKQAAKQKLFPEQESEKTHGSFEEMAPPMMPKMKKDELQKGLKGNWKKEGYKIIYGEPYSDRLGTVHTIHVVPPNAGKFNPSEDDGAAWFQINELDHPEYGKHLQVSEANVLPEHRRKGIATAVYNRIEKDTGLKIIPFEDEQTSDAKALWANPNKSFGPRGVEYNKKKQINKSKLKKAIDPKVKKFEISDAIVKGSARNELKKAIDPRDFKKIQTSHQKGFSTVVDSASHVKDHPAHEGFVDYVVNNPHVYKNKSGKEQGIATKTIHHLDGFEDEDGDFVRKASPTTFMVKPYHGHLESATKSYVKHPIKGWATLATKDLLHAAGMGHMTEDVQAHVHNGVPVTVHRFSKDHEPAFIHKGDALHPRDVAKVAIMDFLTGNNDRHAGNIMVSANKNEEGYHNPLLIDHERNFNYHRSIENKFAPASNGPGKDSPYHTFKHSYGLRAVGHEHEGHPIMEQMDDVHRWWNEAAPQVHAAFQKNIKHIKDPHIRTHIENNFNARMNYLEDNLLNGNYYDMFKGVKKGPWSNETHPAMGAVNIIPFRKPRST